MKLIEKKIIADPDTFQPTMRVTIDISLEAYADGNFQMSEDEFALVVGKELVSLVTKEGVSWVKE